MASQEPDDGGVELEPEREEELVDGEGQEHGEGTEPAGGGKAALTAAQRARMERNRLRARALHHARLVPAPPTLAAGARAAKPVDTGGGFLAEEVPAAPARVVAPHAPIVHRAEQPHCERCERPFPQSYLLDTFSLGVCDACRDDADSDELVARTDAKAEYLLKDCDLDSRPPPLRCVRRRNPHSARYGDMRLYLRAQVAARALLVWGSEAALEAERARRGAARARTEHARTHRRLRALRMDVRSSLYRAPAAERAHVHAFGAERYDAAADCYSRECDQCGHTETYEKM